MLHQYLGMLFLKSHVISISQLAAGRFTADFAEGVEATEALLGKDAETDRIREGISKGPA